MAQPTLGAADALELVGVNAKMFENVQTHGDYFAAPRGRPRVFDVDDLVGLTIFRVLLEIGAMPGGAARIASGVREILRRRPKIEILFLVAGTDAATGKPSPRLVEKLGPGDDELHKFRVGAYRRQARIDMRRFSQEK